MKKVLGLAAAGLLAISTAQAGTITVANSDLTLYGAVTAGFETQDSNLNTDLDPNTSGTQRGSADTFRLYNVIIGLMKKADPNSPIGFNVAFGQFEVPTVFASTETVNEANNGNSLLGLGQTNNSFKPWLATVDIVPMDGLKLSGGILWSKYGERPVTFLNPHISRGLMYVFFNPVAYTGARVEYSLDLPGLGKVGVYAGYNQANGLLQDSDPLDFHQGYYSNGAAKLDATPDDAYELGITGNLNLGAKIKYGLHYYDEAGGRNIWTLCLKSDFGLVKGGIQYSYAKKDDAIKDYRVGTFVNANYDSKRDDSYWGIGINFNISLLDAAIANVEIPMRIEYVKLDRDNFFVGDDPVNGDSGTGKDKIWSFTITPTWKPTKNTFLRAEYTYTKADSKIFRDTDPKATTSDDTRNTYAIEAGFLF